MQANKNKIKRFARVVGTCAALGLAAVSMAGCVAYEPAPGYAPAPAAYGYYGAQPCCYAYPAYYGPPVSVGVGFGGGRRYWR